MDEKLMEILAQVLEERGLHKDAADFRDGDKAPVAVEAMRRAYQAGRTDARRSARIIIRGFMHKLVSFQEWRAACDDLFPLTR